MLLFIHDYLGGMPMIVSRRILPVAPSVFRQSGEVGDHTLMIEFLDTGTQVFAFTFG